MGSEIDENALIKMAEKIAQDRVRSRALALADGKRRLPLVNVGTGTTAYTRRMRPEDIPERCPRLRRLAERYWRAKWPSDPDADRYRLAEAMEWARANVGPQRKKAQHENWYAQKILDLSLFVSPDIDPDEIDDADMIVGDAVESACEIGALYREVRWKLEHEAAAIAAYMLHQKRLKGSERGGVSTQNAAARRRQILAELALKSVRDWVGWSPDQQIRHLKKLARDYDKSADPPVFHHRSALLSDRWFSDSLSDLKSSGAIHAALKKP